MPALPSTWRVVWPFDGQPGRVEGWPFPVVVVFVDGVPMTKFFFDAYESDTWLSCETTGLAAATLRAWAQAERDRANHLKRREKSIIEACERVADGGQYRADIVSAIQGIRRERDNLRQLVLDVLAERDSEVGALTDVGVRLRAEAERIRALRGV